MSFKPQIDPKLNVSLKFIGPKYQYNHLNIQLIDKNIMQRSTLPHLSTYTNRTHKKKFLTWLIVYAQVM